MTPNNYLIKEITTKNKFRDALGELIDSTTKNEVSIKGSWVYRSDNTGQENWEVMIIELE